MKTKRTKGKSVVKAATRRVVATRKRAVRVLRKAGRSAARKIKAKTSGTSRGQSGSHSGRKRVNAKRTQRKRVSLRVKGSRGSSGINSLWLYGVIAAPIVISLLLWRLYVPAALPEPVEPIRTPAQVQPKVEVPPPQPGAKAEDQVQTTAASTAAEVLGSEFAQATMKDVSARAVFWSERMWASPDVRRRISKIEGAPAIQDHVPLVPPTYDCTTFVETVAALARSRRESDFYRNLLAIRYNESAATFRARNHFPEADWIPNNVKAGILSQITEEIAGQAGVFVAVEKKSIDRSKWLESMVKQRKVSRDIASAAAGEAWKAPREASVSYIAMTDLDRVERHIPDGAIVNLVRKNSEKQAVLITHQGFAVRSGGVLMLRHVTPTGNIRTVRLSEFLKAMYAKDRFSWPVLGLNFNRLSST